MMRKWCGWCVVLATMDGHDLGRWNRPFAKSGMPRSCMICIQIESESYLFCLLPAAVQGVSAILTPNGARRHRGCSVELLLKTLKRELLKWRCWLGHSSWMIVSCHRLLRRLNCFGSSPGWHFKESFQVCLQKRNICCMLCNCIQTQTSRLNRSSVYCIPDQQVAAPALAIGILGALVYFNMFLWGKQLEPAQPEVHGFD